MANEPELTNGQGTVSYSRKVAVRQYESAEATIWVQFDIPTEEDGSVSIGSVREAAVPAFYEAKKTVLDQLCLPYEVLDNVVVETLDKVLGPVEVISSTGNASPAPTAGDSAAKARPNWADNAPKGKEALKAELADHPERYFDNRLGKRNPKAPDYKRKFTNEGIWLTEFKA